MTEPAGPASAIKSNPAGKHESSRRMIFDPPAGERRAADRGRCAMPESKGSTELARAFPNQVGEARRRS